MAQGATILYPQAASKVSESSPKANIQRKGAANVHEPIAPNHDESAIILS